MYIVLANADEVEAVLGDTMFFANNLDFVAKFTQKIAAKHPNQTIIVYRMCKKTVPKVSFEFRHYTISDKGEIIPE